MGLAARLRMSRLCVAMDTRRISGDLESLAESVYAQGADMLVLSENPVRPSHMVAALEVVRSVAFHHRHGLVAVAGSLDAARQFGADLVEIEASANAAEARSALHQWALVGQRVTSGAEIDLALADPNVSHLLVGPGFGADAEPNLELIRHAASAAPPGDIGSKPWFAFGGLTLANVDQVFAAGARRLLVSDAVVGSDDPGAICGQFKDRLRRLWHADESMQGYVFGVLSSGGKADGFAG